MATQASRYTSPTPATAAEGWTIERLTPPSRLAGANGLRARDGKLFVAQVAGSQVSAIDVDSGAIETYGSPSSGITGPDDLAFDDEGNLYVTEITENKVRMIRPDGTSRVLMDDLAVANPITYHQGRLIAGELQMGGRIVEIDRNGGGHRTIVEGLPMVNAFEVGPDGKLYFPAQAANEIWRVGLDGGEPEVVATGLGVPDSVKFHPDGYIVSTQVHSGQVLRIDPRTGDKTVLADIGAGLDNVAFVNGRTFVSHITGSIHEITASGAKPLVDRGFQWPIGLAEGPDGTLFVSDGGFTYTLAPGGTPQLIGMLFDAGFPGWVRDVAPLGVGEWAVTTANGTVARWKPAEQASEQLATGYDRPMGIAVTTRGALVFAEMPTGRVLSFDGRETSEIGSGLAQPTGVAVGPDDTVYVSESDGGRVVSLSGGKAKTVIDGLGRPEGLAVSGGKLYVIDVVAKDLIEVELATGTRRTIASDLPVGAPPGLVRKQLGGVGDMCGPMTVMTGLAAGADGTLYLSADAEGSVMAIRAA